MLCAAAQLIREFGVPIGKAGAPFASRACSCCGEKTLFVVEYDDPQHTLLRLCSRCDVTRDEAVS